MVLEDRHVKSARKPWACDGCNREFGPGSEKFCQRAAIDHEIYTFCACSTCRRVMDAMFAEPSDRWLDGIRADDIHEWVVEHYGSFDAADAALAESKEADRG